MKISIDKGTTVLGYTVCWLGDQLNGGHTEMSYFDIQGYLGPIKMLEKESFEMIARTQSGDKKVEEK